MGNMQSAPTSPFGLEDDEPEPVPIDSNSATETFHRNQQVPYPGGKYIGAYVSDPNPKGHPHEVELTVPTLGKHKSFTIRFPKAAVQEEMNRASDPLSLDHNNEDTPAVMATPIGCGPCGVCCWSPTLFFQPRRVIASMFCWLNAILIIYIFCALGLMSAMGELCSMKYVQQIEDGFSAQSVSSSAPDYNAPASAAYQAPVPDTGYQAPAVKEVAAAGYRLLGAYEANADAAAAPGYTAPTAAAVKEDYAPHSAYVNFAGYSQDFVGPACNRLVSFTCAWSCLMAIGVSIYGCCVFRHWHHHGHVIGFYMACLFWMAVDFFSVGLVFAFDANSLSNIEDPMYHMNANGNGNGGRQLKGTTDDLAWAYEIEICACVMAFVMSYMYLMFGLNVWRYSGALIYEWNKPRAATVETSQNRLTGDTSRDFRQFRPKSTYYCNEHTTDH